MAENDRKRGSRNPHARQATWQERKQIKRQVQAEQRVRQTFGGTVAVLGVVVALGLDFGPHAVDLTGPTGIVLGALAYALGARLLRTAALVLSTAAILVGLTAD